MNYALRNALNIGQRRVAKAQNAYQHSRAIQWRGLTFGVENDVGTTRQGKSADGTAWQTTMYTPYTEIIATLAVDGDCIDAFVNETGLDTCTDAYVIGIVNEAGNFDEEKVFLGYASAAEALDDFRRHYDVAENYFGYLSGVPIDTFVRRCLEPESRGKSLIPNAISRAKLGQKRIRQAKAARADRADWMQAIVAKAQSVRQVAKGLSVEQIDAKVASLGSEEPCAEVDYQLELLRYARVAQSAPREVSKAIAMPAPTEDLYIRIWPGKNVADLQKQVIPVDLIYKSWAYYERCGNIDLEHISRIGGKTWREKAAKIEAAGFDPHHQFARVQYEIGRPVPGSLRIEEMDDKGNVVDFSYVAKIHGGDNEAAQWFRSTLPHIPWKPSVYGFMSEPVAIETPIDDPLLGYNSRKTKIEVARDFRWSSTAATLEPVNHWTRPFEILSTEEVAQLLAVPAAESTVSV